MKGRRDLEGEMRSRLLRQLHHVAQVGGQPELPQVRAELEYRVRLHYEASYVQYASWSSEATDAAHEAFLGASQYVVPWQCDVIL